MLVKMTLGYCKRLTRFQRKVIEFIVLLIVSDAQKRLQLTREGPPVSETKLDETHTNR